MKDTEIHKGLDKAEVRDLISKGIVDSFVNSGDTRTIEPVDSNLPPSKRSVIYAQKELEKAKANLERAERLDALVTVMQMMGWKEFDVSDDVTRSYGKLTMNFIGTQEEYENLLNKLK